MASVARSVMRSVSSRAAAAAIATESRASIGGGASSFVKAAKKRVGLQKQSLRGMSFCVESMMAYHNATASALMTSKLSVNGRSDVWFPQGKDKTR